MSTTVETVRIKELDVDMIPPTTATYKQLEQGGSKIVVVGKPGCFTAGTPVLMYNGSIKNVEDVLEGDLVMGPDSNPRKVMELCRNSDEMFKVIPITGDPYTVNLQHKLVLKSRGYIIEISVAEFLQKSETWQNRWHIFRTGVDFPTQKVNLDPYLLGLEIADNHIPLSYKANDRKTRLELLAGIIDKNGYYDIKANNYDVTQKNETLLDDIVFLARSLGFAAEKKPCTKSCISDGKITETTHYRTYISGNIEDIPCRILTKPRKCLEDHLSTGFRLESQGHGDYYGFTIDGDHRFLLGSFDVVRNTGKTTLIASLLYAKKHIFPVGIAMSGTEDSNHFYRSVLPSTFVFNTYDEDQLEKFIKRQKIARDHLENPWAVVILDDCTDDPALFRKPLQNGMYKRGRHWKMWYILSLQYGMDVRPVIRTNIDGVFILREPNMRNRRVMYENYASIIPDFKLFCDIMDQLTNDYTALYIHNAKQTNNWQDCVFWYKAKPVSKDFKFGSEDYWNFHYQRYNPDYVDPITV